MASKISRWSGVSWVVVSDLDQVTGMLPLAGGTMTGPIVMAAGTAGSEAIKFSRTGDYMAWWAGATRNGYLQGHTGGITLAAEVGSLSLSGPAVSVAAGSNYVSFPNNTRVGIITAYGGSYGGIGWSNGQYLIMSDGTNSFVTAPNGGFVSVRGGTNGSYQLNINASGNHQLVGNLDLAGYSIAGVNALSISGDFHCNGDYSNGIQCYGGMTINGNSSMQHIDCNNIDTRDGYRFISNGGYDGSWNNRAYVAQRWSGSNRTGYAIHPGGVAKAMEMMQNNGYVNFMNEDSSWYADLYCNSIVQASQGRGKQNVKPWPAKSAGSAVMDACNRLSLIDVIEYQIKPEMALIQADTMIVHDCAVDDCPGTDMETDPCQRVKDWSTPMIGVLIEDLATVLPEAVGLDPDGNPGGMRLGSMIGYLLAVCKEQQDRIEILEQHLQEAA